MKLNRREMLALGGATAALMTVGVPVLAVAKSRPIVDEQIKAFAGGADIKKGKISLSAPEIAENGNTVPVEISVESPMTADNYVAEVLILATGNPNPGVATFMFTPMSGAAEASTRIRLARTQDVIAIAKMSDGSFFKDSKQVKVTIGGCGG